jgi:hypothetical protein
MERLAELTLYKPLNSTAAKKKWRKEEIKCSFRRFAFFYIIHFVSCFHGNLEMRGTTVEEYTLSLCSTPCHQKWVEPDLSIMEDSSTNGRRSFDIKQALADAPKESLALEESEDVQRLFQNPTIFT